MLPVDENRPVFGSYTSALAQVVGGLYPPASSTVPFGSRVAVATVRALFALPVGEKAPPCAAAGRGRLNRRSKMALASAQRVLFFFLAASKLLAAIEVTIDFIYSSFYFADIILNFSAHTRISSPLERPRHPDPQSKPRRNTTSLGNSLAGI